MTSKGIAQRLIAKYGPRIARTFAIERRYRATEALNAATQFADIAHAAGRVTLWSCIETHIERQA